MGTLLTLSDLLGQLRTLDVRLTVESGKLSVSAPKGAITEQCQKDLGMKLTVEEVRLTPVTADVVVVDKYQLLSGQTDGPGGKVLPDRHVRQTYVLRRLGGRWQIAVERVADLRR